MSRFGEMLLTRRRELGLSIQQVANTIKMRPQIIEYFETGNFAAMPPRGYAQGMISSYARFLGLNPREVVETYFDELYEFERTESISAGSAFQEGATNPVPRSSQQAGRYLMVGAQLPSSRYGQRPPQAGYVSDAGPGTYGQQATGPAGRGYDGYRPRGSSRGYASREGIPQASSHFDRRDSGASRVRQGHMDRGHTSVAPRMEDGHRGSYPPHGTRGRAGVPGGSREQYRGGGRVPYGGNAGGRGGNRAGHGPSSQLDPRLFYGALAAVLVLLVLVIVLLVRGCTAPSAQPDVKAASGSAATSIDSPQSAESPDPATSEDDSDGAATDQDNPASENPTSPDGEQPVTPTETNVTVSIAEGKTSWVEVKVDGEVAYSGYPVGPFELNYTPTKTFEILVNQPGEVEVRKNGEKVSWDTKTSGVGRLTITVPQPETPQDGQTPDSAGTTTDEPQGAAAAQ